MQKADCAARFFDERNKYIIRFIYAREIQKTALCRKKLSFFRHIRVIMIDIRVLFCYNYMHYFFNYIQRRSVRTVFRDADRTEGTPL